MGNEKGKDETEKKITAKLSYNPYLLETNIKFNEIEPRVNSRVEKYLNSNLQDWVNDIPEIFREEMNGYDFELEFTGTELDYKEVKRAFEHAGVPKDRVIVNHKGGLEERGEKVRRVKELLKWLEANPNEHFDYEDFRRQNEELFDGAYPLVVLQDNSTALPSIDWKSVSAERIDETDELDYTDLNHVPIVVVIGEENNNDIQSITKFLKDRNDVTDNQVFFLIDDKLDKGMVTRVLIDLGFKEPQVVGKLDDYSIKNYFDLYPQTDYVSHAIEKLAEKANEVAYSLHEENKTNEETSSEVQKIIAEKEKLINILKDADNILMNRDVLDIMPQFSRAKIDMLVKIVNWRRKKTKITSEEEAEILAVELSKEVSLSYDVFSKEIAVIEDERITKIAEKIRELYLTAKYDSNFVPKDIRADRFDIRHTPRIEQELLQIKEYVPVERREQGLFFMPKNTSDSIDMDMETTYYTQKWRDYAIGIAEPMADELMKNRATVLQKYDERLANAYHEHLAELIKKYEKEKDMTSQQLSSEERQLQIDNYWIADFKDQLKKIERG